MYIFTSMQHLPLKLANHLHVIEPSFTTFTFSLLINQPTSNFVAVLFRAPFLFIKLWLFLVSWLGRFGQIFGHVTNLKSRNSSNYSEFLLHLINLDNGNWSVLIWFHMITCHSKDWPESIFVMICSCLIKRILLELRTAYGIYEWILHIYRYSILWRVY